MQYIFQEAKFRHQEVLSGNVLDEVSEFLSLSENGYFLFQCYASKYLHIMFKNQVLSQYYINESFFPKGYLSLPNLAILALLNFNNANMFCDYSLWNCSIRYHNSNYKYDLKRSFVTTYASTPFKLYIYMHTMYIYAMIVFLALY